MEFLIHLDTCEERVELKHTNWHCVESKPQLKYLFDTGNQKWIQFVIISRIFVLVAVVLEQGRCG
jgi:hypothetical protein